MFQKGHSLLTHHVNNDLQLFHQSFHQFSNHKRLLPHLNHILRKYLDYKEPEIEKYKNLYHKIYTIPHAKAVLEIAASKDYLLKCTDDRHLFKL